MANNQNLLALGNGLSNLPFASPCALLGLFF